mmetsp:Transcript_1238/g.1885  ORF Transcript_1238/g.1885 Transcript_1238/m.1885 type:complete len:203 (-) Transcript_1238:60-668(-)
MAQTSGTPLLLRRWKKFVADSMRGTTSLLFSMDLMSKMSAPAMKPSGLPEVKTTPWMEVLGWISVFQSVSASSLSLKLMVLTFLAGLSNRMMAIPSGVISTFWKNSYFRSGVGTKGVGSDFGVALAVTSSASVLATADENCNFALVWNNCPDFPSVLIGGVLSRKEACSCPCVWSEERAGPKERRAEERLETDERVLPSILS